MQKTKRAPAILSLAFLFFASLPATGQVCESDGLNIEFRLHGNEEEVVLQDVRINEIVDQRSSDNSVSLVSGPTYARNDNGVIRVEGLKVADFPSESLFTKSFQRKRNNVWEINFPRGYFEFQRKSDLEIEMIFEVIGGAAAHVSGANASFVSVNVDPGKTHELWWGGTNSLRRLWGNLEFQFLDLSNLSLAGAHRAKINMCVNIKGHL